MKILPRILIFISILLLDFAFGWEWGFAALLFFLSLKPDYYEFLILGALFDINFSFPFAFFTILIFILILISKALFKYLKEDNITSVLARALALSLFSCLAFFAIFTLGMWPEIISAASLTLRSASSIFTFIFVVIILYKILEYFYEPKKI